MICINCGREIPELSIYCNWCGKKQIKEKKGQKTITVPEPRQLPSGAWNIQLRKEGESITEYTAERCRKVALQVRRQWLIEKRLGIHEEPEAQIMTLGNAIDRYIESNSNILSVSTTRSYMSYRKHRMQESMSWNIFEPNNWQAAVNKELEDISPKTAGNVWRLCTAAMRSVGAPVPQINLRRWVSKEHQFLRHDQIASFLDAIKDEECELPCLLGLHSLRLSESLALRPSDVSLKKKTLSIRGSRVLNSEGLLVYSELNKTSKSRRDVPILIPRLSILLRKVDPNCEYICEEWEQKRLYDHINRICKANGLPKIGVHGLRHSFASLAYHLGWKEKSTMAVGGWSNSDIVHEIYTHNADLDVDVETMREFYKR